MIGIKIQRFFQNFLMLGWGVACLYWGIVADFEKLLHPSFQIPVICAGVVFIFLSVISADSPSLTKCSHDLSWESLAFGMIGLGAVLLCRPEGLSMKTVLNRDAESAAVDASGRDQSLAENWKKHSGNEEIFLDLLDLFYVARDPQLRGKIEGKRVAIIGQVAQKKGFSLMRTMMWCCVADARPVMVEMRDYGSSLFKEGDWVEVRGTVSFEDQGGVLLPIVHYQESKSVPEPEELYLF